jgi:hypothetical protein
LIARVPLDHRGIVAEALRLTLDQQAFAQTVGQ